MQFRLRPTGALPLHLLPALHSTLRQTERQHGGQHELRGEQRGGGSSRRRRGAPAGGGAAARRNTGRSQVRFGPVGFGSRVRPDGWQMEPNGDGLHIMSDPVPLDQNPVRGSEWKL